MYHTETNKINSLFKTFKTENQRARKALFSCVVFAKLIYYNVSRREYSSLILKKCLAECLILNTNLHNKRKVPCSQYFPSNPLAHEHWNPPIMFMQVAPFLHGSLVAHSSISRKEDYPKDLETSICSRNYVHADWWSDRQNLFNYQTRYS